MTTPSYRRNRRLGSRSTMTLRYMQEHPEILVSPQDMASAGVGPGSYQALAYWIFKQKVPPPIRLPNGRLKWVARKLLKHLGLPIEDGADAA